ncbi:MAG: hypothetical protein NTV80_22155 [Verrucomicrobia bacterium]|nr:hypothetical protein [Verrucomicrobiota bacterium]
MTKAHEEIITFIASGTTSQSILAFAPSPEAKARVDGLIQKKRPIAFLPMKPASWRTTLSSNI